MRFPVCNRAVFERKTSVGLPCFFGRLVATVWCNFESCSMMNIFLLFVIPRKDAIELTSVEWKKCHISLLFSDSSSLPMKDRVMLPLLVRIVLDSVAMISLPSAWTRGGGDSNFIFVVMAITIPIFFGKKSVSVAVWENAKGKSTNKIGIRTEDYFIDPAVNHDLYLAFLMTFHYLRSCSFFRSIPLKQTALMQRTE